MQRRRFLKLFSTVPFLAGCGYLRIDPWHVLVRSDSIRSLEDEASILKHAKAGYTKNGRVRVLFVKGDAYDRGYQHGSLLRDEVRHNLEYLYEQALETFYFEELFAEAYERMRPYIPQEYVEEMHGLAHGSKLPLHLIHHIHALPTMSEWGGKKRVKAIVKGMMSGDLGTSCSNIAASGSATPDGSVYTVRVLDWGLHKISRLHEHPLITIGRPTNGVPYANIGWTGFLGAISGMNAEGITLGEMGYGDPANETMAGRPMPFLLRDVLSKCRNLADVRKVIGESPGENSYVFLMSDGKTGEAEMYIKDPDRFLTFKAGSDLKDGEEDIKGIKDVVYGGHSNQRMGELLNQFRGEITPEILMTKVVPEIAMKSNFQNVVYDPARLRFWVNFAKNKEIRAAEQEYTFFDMKEALESFR